MGEGCTALTDHFAAKPRSLHLRAPCKLGRAAHPRLPKHREEPHGLLDHPTEAEGKQNIGLWICSLGLILEL